MRMVKAKVGMRVHVFSPDQSKYLGMGTIVKVDDLIIAETKEVLSKNYPTIKLDTGKKLGGMDCWWGEAQNVGTCDNCDAEKVERHKMETVSNNYGDGKEATPIDVQYVCFECYKKKMSIFRQPEQDTLRMFYSDSEE